MARGFKVQDPDMARALEAEGFRLSGGFWRKRVPDVRGPEFEEEWRAEQCLQGLFLRSRFVTGSGRWGGAIRLEFWPAALRRFSAIREV